MISRAQFMQLVETDDANNAYSSKELAQLLQVPLGTLNGWLSDKRAFPPSEVGARKRRVYNKHTIIRIAVYSDCLSNGYGMDASDIRLIMPSLDIEEVWIYYSRGMAEFASYMIEKKELVLGGNNG
jgi:DNA-binding transcriptional MerR regulator